eukprot:406697_1
MKYKHLLTMSFRNCYKFQFKYFVSKRYIGASTIQDKLDDNFHDIIERIDEFDDIKYKADEQKNFVVSEMDNIIYPMPYNYGNDYIQSFPINEIIAYLEKLRPMEIKVYDVSKCTNDNEGYGIMEDKDWFVISIVSNHDELSNIVKKLIRQGHDKKVFNDSYYEEVHSSYFSSEGESDWCLVDLADTLILVCHKDLLNDSLSMVNQIKDKFWRFLYSTYYPKKKC